MRNINIPTKPCEIGSVCPGQLKFLIEHDAETSMLVQLVYCQGIITAGEKGITCA